eukprot:532242_1
MIFFIFAASLLQVAVAQAYNNCTSTTYCQNLYGSDYFCNSNQTCEYMDCVNTPDYCETHGDFGSICEPTMRYCETWGCMYNSDCSGQATNNLCDTVGNWNCVPSCVGEDPLFCSQKRGDDPHSLCNSTSELCTDRHCTTDADCGGTPFVCESDGRCVQGCEWNNTFCREDLHYDPEYLCQSSGLCETTSCTMESECAALEAVCDTDNGICTPRCNDNAHCANMNDYNWECTVDSYCVFRQCNNDTICVNNNQDGWTCDKSDPSHWECVEPSCVGNSADYCFTQYGQGQACNTTSGHCEYAYCMQDSDCASNVCMWGMDCAPSCIGRASRWCANAFQNEHYSCNTTNGHCWERPCDIALNDCPTDYVCKEEYGWAHCMLGCVNDTECAQDNNYDESFKCQGNGLCERDTCADPVDCTESGYTCSQFNECVPGCQNNYDCEMNHGSPEWQCGVDSYCVYRECLNDTICINNRGTYYTCNKTNDDYWQCTRPYCNDDNDCEVGQLCDNYMGDNYCRAGCSNDTDCDYIFYGMKPMCDTATSTCHEENCVNTPSLCSGNGPGSYCNATTGYCEDDWCYDDSECTHPTNTICNNNWMRCVPPCDPFVPLLPKWCATEFNNEYSSCNMSNGQCWEKGCTDDTDCPSAYVCKDRGGWSTCAVDCASNDTYCAETNNGDTSFKCQVNGVCEQYSCTDHSECGSGSRCNAFGNCVSGCQNNTVCASSHGWDWNWKCGDNNYCVYRACYNDTDCYHQYAMPEYICNTTSLDYWQCVYDDPNTYCSNDTDCSSTEVCHWGQCVADCTTQSNGRWCGNRYGDSYSCNPNDGHCWERPCDIALNDCPMDYACKEEYGWAHCVVACVNDTDCAYTPNGYYDTSYKCQDDGLCERDSCVAGMCTDSEYVCNGLDKCVPGCSNSTQCMMDHNWDDKWTCEGYCVYRECHNDTDCFHQYAMPEYICNMTSFDYWQCAYDDPNTYCGWDGDCGNSEVCDQMYGSCVSHCDTEATDWCANAFHNEFYSCNSTNGHCWEKPCDSADPLSCPIDYVCQDRGWGTYCAVSCMSNNDTYCAQQHGYDESFKCQASGLCERDPCTQSSDCPESEYTCSQYDECVPGCQNNTVCASSHGWDWDWKCGDNNYCVYRACYNDTDCPHMGSPGACNTTSDDHWQCEWSSGQNDCYGDWECDGDDICESMACTARCYQDYDCDMMYGDGRPICNMTSGRCESRNCANTPNYCEMYGAHPVGAICDSGECVYETCATNNDCMNFPACHDGICGPNCNGDSTWCEQTFGIGFECFPDETCGKQSCATTAECSSSKVCLFGNCEEDCGNHITLDPYFCQYQSYLDHTGDLKFGDSVICNQATGACEFEWCVDSTECSVGFICDIDMWMNCIRDCNSMNDTFCEERMGYGYYCSSDGICDEFTYTTPDPTDTTSQYTTQPPDTTGLDTTEPVTTEPDTTTGLDTTEPDTTEPDTTEPETTELETTELETTELETTELETTEEPETYCSADVNDDFCFELAGAQTCHRTASDFDTFKGQSPHSGQHTNKMCELCARYGSDQTGDLCQCLLLLKNNVIPDLGRAREKVKQIIVDECWQTADGPCSSFDNIVAQTEGCGCGALSCDDSVGGLTESGGGDSNKAYKYSIDVAVWIAFFMYVIQ